MRIQQVNSIFRKVWNKLFSQNLWISFWLRVDLSLSNRYSLSNKHASYLTVNYLINKLIFNKYAFTVTEKSIW